MIGLVDFSHSAEDANSEEGVCHLDKKNESEDGSAVGMPQVTKASPERSQYKWFTYIRAGLKQIDAASLWSQMDWRHTEVGDRSWVALSAKDCALLGWPCASCSDCSAAMAKKMSRRDRSCMACWIKRKAGSACPQSDIDKYQQT